MPRLERETIVRNALELLNEVGLDGLTLRRLAEKLSVQASALYWHFESKQKLIDAMAEAMLMSNEPFEPAAVTGKDWGSKLMMAGQKLRALLLAHRDGARLLASADMGNTASLARMDYLLGTLIAAGFRPKDGLQGVFTVINFTLGSVFEVQADPGRRSEVKAGDLAQLLHEDLLPNLRAAYKDLAVESGVVHSETEFNASLEIIVTGLAERLRRRDA